MMQPDQYDGYSIRYLCSAPGFHFIPELEIEKMNCLLRAFFTCLVVSYCSVALALPRYGITDLGTAGGLGLEPYCCSESVLVAGSASDGSAFLYSPGGGVQFIAPPPGYSCIVPTGVNDSGETIGYYSDAGFSNSHAFVYKPGVGVTPLNIASNPVCLSNPMSNVCGINNTGVITGYFTDANGIYHVCTMSAAGVTTDLGTIDNSAYLNSICINDSGHVLGSYGQEVTESWGEDEVEPEAFLSADGQIQDLNSISEIADYSSSMTRRILEANGINSAGQVVGMAGLYDTASGDPGLSTDEIGADSLYSYSPAHAFLYTPGNAPVDLGVLPGFDSFSDAMSVNDLGQVVGCSWRSSDALGDSYCAFLYSDGRMYDLNTLLGGATGGWTLTQASEIDNKGDILATGYKSVGQERNYGTLLLTPVPEPSSLAVLLLGVVALVKNRCIRRAQRTDGLASR